MVEVVLRVMPRSEEETFVVGRRLPGTVAVMFMIVPSGRVMGVNDMLAPNGIRLTLALNTPAAGGRDGTAEIVVGLVDVEVVVCVGVQVV